MFITLIINQMWSPVTRQMEASHSEVGWQHVQRYYCKASDVGFIVHDCRDQITVGMIGFGDR